MENDNSIVDKIKDWRQRLKQALKSNDLMYAMHCDEMIVKLKREQYVHSKTN